MFGGEMLTVLAEEGSGGSNRRVMARIRLFAREASGLLLGAAREHLRALVEIHDGLALATGRFEMRNGFRFPKSTILFMTLILAGVLLAIKRGEDIAASFPPANPQAAPIQLAHSTVSPIAMLVVLFYAFGLVGGAILVALRRSGGDGRL